MGRAGSTSVMWRIADGGGVEQLDGSFLYQRTHTLDPDRSIRVTSILWPLPKYKGRSSNLAGWRVIAEASIGGGAGERLKPAVEWPSLKL